MHACFNRTLIFFQTGIVHQRYNRSLYPKLEVPTFPKFSSLLWSLDKNLSCRIFQKMCGQLLISLSDLLYENDRHLLPLQKCSIYCFCSIHCCYTESVLQSSCILRASVQNLLDFVHFWRFYILFILSHKLNMLFVTKNPDKLSFWQFQSTQPSKIP